MFGSKKVVESGGGSSSSSAGATTLISQNTEIVGDMVFAGSLVIEGKVTGNVVAASGAEANLRLLESGEVVGEIRVPTVIINGRVNGDVYSTSHLELAAKAVVDGNVHYQLIEMVKGAQVNGKLVADAGEPAAAPAKTAEKTKSTPVSAEADASEALKSAEIKPIKA